MRVVVGPLLWEKLRAGEEYEYVRSALYLGYGIEHIADTARRSRCAFERQSVVETAKSLGITEDDVIVLDKDAVP